MLKLMAMVAESVKDSKFVLSLGMYLGMEST